MLDPLSLNDFPSIVEKKFATITVKVNSEPPILNETELEPPKIHGATSTALHIPGTVMHRRHSGGIDDNK